MTAVIGRDLAVAAATNLIAHELDAWASIGVRRMRRKRGWGALFRTRIEKQAPNAHRANHRANHQNGRVKSLADFFLASTWVHLGHWGFPRQTSRTHDARRRYRARS
jgi:hypothetical protein